MKAESTRDGELLQEFVRVLLGREPPPSLGTLPVSELLTRLAGKALAADAVQEFCLRLVCDRRYAEELLAMEPGAALATARHRVRQFLLDQDPEWSTRKLLREHVRAAMGSELPHATELPADLLKDDRIQRDRVCQAVAYFEAFEPHPTNDTDEKARRYAERLKELYFGGQVDSAPAASDDVPGFPSGPHSFLNTEEEYARRCLDAKRIVEMMRRSFNSPDLHILQMRLNERTLAEISAAVGLPLATVHDRLKKVEEAMVARLSSVGTAGTVHFALQLFRRANPDAEDPLPDVAAGLSAAEQNVYRRSRVRSARNRPK